MTEIQEVRQEFERERAQLARSVRNGRPRRSKGSACELPSDNLSRKEIEKMNGEVTTIKLNEPMSWNEFKSLSPTLQKNYLDHLIVHHSASISSIGTEMFGISHNTLYKYLDNHGIKCTQATRRGKAGAIKWSNFLKNERKTSNTTEPEVALDYSKNPDGDCVSIDLNKPMDWVRFKKLSPNLQKAYVEHLLDKHGASLRSISNDLFGLSNNTLNMYLRQHNIHLDIPLPKAFNPKHMVSWNNFLIENGLKDPNTTELEAALNYSNNPKQDTKVDQSPEFVLDFTLARVTNWDELRKLIAGLEGISLEEGYRITLRVQRSGE